MTRCSARPVAMIRLLAVTTKEGEGVSPHPPWTRKGLRGTMSRPVGYYLAGPEHLWKLLYSAGRPLVLSRPRIRDHRPRHRRSYRAAPGADLTPVYELIFRRMRHIGLSWRYAHPRLYAIDLGSLPNPAEDDVPEALGYNPTGSFWRERQLAERQTERAEFQKDLDDAYRASVHDAYVGPPPATVRAYQRVYGRNPDGWPPQVEDQE